MQNLAEMFSIVTVSSTDEPHECLKSPHNFFVGISLAVHAAITTVPIAQVCGVDIFRFAFTTPYGTSLVVATHVVNAI